MTVIYFVRHAEPDYNDHNDLTRPLTEKGKEDVALVNRFFEDKEIDYVMSSPFLRAVDTVASLAAGINKEVLILEDFRERKIDNGWIDDFDAFAEKQWSDFDYKLKDGESLREVQNRNINALNGVRTAYKDKTLVIGSHGAALSTIINYYNKTFGYENFRAIKSLMPWIVKFTFEEDRCVSIDQFNVFSMYGS
jgi:2,3-bisphosphoglycerate-dependent phosphoglycerate mutase